MSRISACPYCQGRVSIPAGLTGRKRVRCPLCQAEFGLDVGADAVQVFQLPDQGGIGTEAAEQARPTLPRKRRPWEYEFDFGTIFSKSLSFYGTALLATLAYWLVVIFLGIGVGVCFFVIQLVLLPLGIAGAIVMLVLALGLLVALYPLFFGIVAAYLSIARGKSWDASSFFEPYQNFGTWLLFLLVMMGVGIVFGAITFASSLLLFLLRGLGAAGLVPFLMLLAIEFVCFLAVMLRCFVLCPMFLIDEYTVSDAIRWNIRVTSHMQWLYWLVLFVCAAVISIVSFSISFAVRFPLLMAMPNWGGILLGALMGIIIQAIFQPLAMMPIVVAYVEMLKQISRRRADT